MHRDDCVIRIADAARTGGTGLLASACSAATPAETERLLVPPVLRFDSRAALENVANDESLLRELASHGVTTLRDEAHELRAALARDDRKAVAALVHSAKSVLQLFALREMAAWTRCLECTCLRLDAAQLTQTTQQLAWLLEELSAALADWLAAHPGDPA